MTRLHSRGNGKSQFILHILSDSVGETADTVARIIELQFPQLECSFEFTTMVSGVNALRDAVMPYKGVVGHVFVYTFTNREMLEEFRRLSNKENIPGIDVIGTAIDRVSELTGEKPSGKVGVLHQIDNAYFKRIAAMEFSVNHDDGKLPDTLSEADIVLIGVSRTSKTPLSMYLAHRGFKTANIPLTLETQPPGALFEIDPHIIFGLMSSVEMVAKVRTERMAEFGSYIPGYADPVYIEEEFKAARSLMRRLGCLVISTQNRAIESVAQEIMSHL